MLHKILNISVKYKLALANCIILAIFIGMVSLLNFYSSRQLVERKNMEAMLDNAETTAAWIGQKVKAMKTAAEVMASEDVFKHADDSAAVATRLAELKQSLPTAENVAFVWPDGRFVGAEGQRGTIAGRAYFQEAVRQNKTMVSDEPVISSLSGESVIVVMAPLRDDYGHAQGQQLGYVNIALPTAEFEVYIWQRTFGKAGYTCLASKAGSIFIHLRPEWRGANLVDGSIGQVFAKQSLEQSNQWDKNIVMVEQDSIGNIIKKDPMTKIEMAQVGKNPVKKYEDDSQRSYTGGIAMVPGTSWMVGAVEPKAEVLNVIDFMRHQAIAVMLLALLGSAAVSYIIADRMSRPLLQLAAGARRLAKGDLTKKLAVSSRDEVGILVEAFNKMGEDIQLLLEKTKRDAEREQIQADAKLAGEFQRRMLPALLNDELIEIQHLYEPLRSVSGDFFDYQMFADKGCLVGYMVDVAGHGIATALETAAINVLLKNFLAQLKKKSQPLTEELLQKLNEEMLGYCADGSFAALIFYRVDFNTGLLTCGFCGINSILLACRKKQGWIKRKGSLMGVFEDAQFSIEQIALRPGDTVYFLTDGLGDRFPAQQLQSLADYPATVSFLNDLAAQKGTDDCSAVCLQIHGIADHFKFYFDGMADVVAMHGKIHRILQQWGKPATKQLEMVINEAINNVLLHGSGQGAISLKRVKQNRIVIRVKDCRQGSSAGRILRRYGSEPPAEVLANMPLNESGRGLLLMKLYTDFMCYNRSGSEVLLIRRLRQEQ